MKRIIATTLTLAIGFGMSATALAAETVGQNGRQDIDVKAKYSDAVTTPDVYSIDIQWDNMTFTYSEAGTMDWNPATHTYTENVTAGWDKDSADVTVMNHSNVPVDVSFGYVPEDSYGITTALTDIENAVNLKAAMEGNLTDIPSVTVTLTVSGTPNKNVTEEGVVVGTITVKII